EQLKQFVGEGRVGPATPVMRGAERWSLASEHPQLAWMFATLPAAQAGAPPPAAAPAPTPAPATSASAPAPPPAPAPGPASASASPPAPVSAATEAPAASPETEAAAAPAKVIIIAELRTGSTITLENAITRLGESYRVNQYVWFLHTLSPIAQVRRELAP